MKIALFDKVKIKKVLYSAIMSCIVGDEQDHIFAPICLLELKFSADTFTVAMVLLNLRPGSQDSKTILTESMKEAL